MDYFIGIVFDPNHLTSVKINNFRKRNDPKFLKGQHLQLTLLAPFSSQIFNRSQFTNFVHELREVFEAQLDGLTELDAIEFHGLDFISGRKSLLGLNPNLPIDLLHCADSVKEVLADYNMQFKNPKSVKAHSQRLGKKGDEDSIAVKSFLTIGRYFDSFELESALSFARSEFSEAFTLPVSQIVLFKNLPHQWVIEEVLYQFEDQKKSTKKNIEKWSEF